MIEHANETFHFCILFLLLWIKNGIGYNRKFTNKLVEYIEAGLFPSFSIRYMYRSLTPTLAANSSLVMPAFCWAALIISPRVSWILCTVGSPLPKYNFIDLSHVYNGTSVQLFMNWQCSWYWTKYMFYPANKKTRFCRGDSTRVPSIPRLELEGYFYALGCPRFAANQKQRVWFKEISRLFSDGIRPKKLLAMKRDCSPLTMNCHAIIYTN